MLMQRDSSPSGVEGKINFTAAGGTVVLKVACPYSGDNEFSVDNPIGIPGVVAVVSGFSGTSGHPTKGTLTFYKIGA